MAGMTGDNNLIARLPWQIAFAVCEQSVLEARVDADLVVSFVHGQELGVGETETPILFVIGRSIGYPIRLLRDREQMCLQVTQRHRRLDRYAVIHYVEVR